MESNRITVKGAREHNLRDVSLTLPRGKLICFTGVSGSGKSSFAFDTLFAEGQRRYLESLSSYARQFLGQLAKPDVDQITGLSPSIAIQQKTSGWNPRSTVGTITQIADYLRVLFARVGTQHCTKCGRPIAAQTREQILARILEFPAGTKALILAPVVRGQKGEQRDLFEEMLRKGYSRARVDGNVVSLSEPPNLVKNQRHDVEIVIDRVVISAAGRARLAEAVEAAIRLGSGTLIVSTVSERSEPARAAGESETRLRRGPRGGSDVDGRASRSPSPPGSKGGLGETPEKSTDLLLSSHYACAKCDLSFEAPSPQLFSFNSPTGMCLACDGLGETFDFVEGLLTPDPTKTFVQGAVEPMRFKGRMGRWRRHIFEGIAKHVGFDLKQPWGKLPEKARRALLYGLGDAHVTFEWRSGRGVWKHGGMFEGVVAELRENHRKANSAFVRSYYEKFMRRAVCGACHGARLNAQALAVRLSSDGGSSGARTKSLYELCDLSIGDARAYLAGLELSATQRLIAADLLREIDARLKFLCEVGLDYLTLNRAAPTLSGGESQRIRLASQIGAGLVGVLYILDEPSIGLHARDNQRLLDSLCHLRDMGNTVIVVEHDEQTMRTADLVVDFGPGPGVRGGEVVAHGDLEAIAKSKRSVTGKFLRGEEKIEVPKDRRPVTHDGTSGLSVPRQSGAVRPTAGAVRPNLERKRTGRTARVNGAGKRSEERSDA